MAHSISWVVLSHAENRRMTFRQVVRTDGCATEGVLEQIPPHRETRLIVHFGQIEPTMCQSFDCPHSRPENLRHHIRKDFGGTLLHPNVRTNGFALTGKKPNSGIDVN